MDEEAKRAFEARAEARLPKGWIVALCRCGMDCPPIVMAPSLKEHAGYGRNSAIAHARELAKVFDSVMARDVATNTLVEWAWRIANAEQPEGFGLPHDFLEDMTGNAAAFAASVEFYGITWDDARIYAQAKPATTPTPDRASN